jgi:hypothetical protein
MTTTLPVGYYRFELVPSILILLARLGIPPF